METYLFRLHFKGPLHLGLHGIGLEAIEERLSSDSLTSALINAAKVLEGEKGAEEMVEALTSPSPPFVLSSLFPFGPHSKRQGTYAEAIVRPLTDPPVEDKKILQRYGKELKRIRYLSVEDFRAWISEKNLTESQLEEIIEKSMEFSKGWWYEEIRPRVALDRRSQNSNIWNQAAIWFLKEDQNKEDGFVKGAGLYGLIRLNDNQWKPKLESTFRILGDMGIGGERTYGLGLFEFGGFEALNEEWRNLFRNQARAHIFLSMYYPADQERHELRKCLQAWDTVERRGYIVSGRNTTTIKRKRVRMVTEGSATSKPLIGCMIDTTPEQASEVGITHKVYRSGLAFLVPGGRM